LEPGLGPRFRGDRAGGGMSGADLTRLRARLFSGFGVLRGEGAGSGRMELLM
jgi:hypothetical protein